MMQTVRPSAAVRCGVAPGRRVTGLGGRVEWDRRVGVSGWVVWPGHRETV